MTAAACASAAPAPAATDTTVDATTASDSQDTATSDSGAAKDSAAAAVADTAKADTAKTPPPCKPWDSPSDWNCPAGTHCGYDTSDAIACVANGTHGVGEDCSDGADCSIGLCISAQNGSQACGNFCTVDAHCDSGSCNGVVNKKYKVCDVAKYTSCNPLSAKCPATQGCYLLGNAGFVCVGAGSKAKGETCKANYECAPGSTCAGLAGAASAVGICRKYCNASGGATGCEDPTTPCSKLGGGAGFCEE